MDDNQAKVEPQGAQGSTYETVGWDLTGAAYAGPYMISTDPSVSFTVNHTNNTSWSVTNLQQPITNGGTGGTIKLTGPDSDIILDGESLRDTLRGIQQRLALLQPNPALETEWDQLRELGNAYRKLEVELLEKQKMWDTLKQMPPPTIE